MQYDSVILELMGRIQLLESRCDALEEQIAVRDSQQADDDNIGEASNPAPRLRMTEERTRACYECGVRLFQNGGANFNEELSKLLARAPMNRNSAIMYVYAVQNMLNGEVYKRAISQSATEQFFKYILEDFGAEKQKAAIRATRKHIEYRLECGHVVSGLIELCDKYERGFKR